MDLRDGLPSAHEVRSLTPAVALSLVVSLDGQLCGPDGSSRSISGPEDLYWLRTLRAAADTVVVGASTAEREGYRPLTASGPFLDFRRAHGLTADIPLVILRSGDDFPELRSLWGPHVLLEAGIRLHRALAPFIDRVWISHSPTLVGDAGAAFALDLPAFRVVSRHRGERFVVSRLERC